MRVISIAICVLATVAAIYTVRLFVRDRSSIRATFFWLVVWIAIGVFAMFPHLIDFFMRGAMMQNRMFFLFVVAILILYAIFFRLSNENADLRYRLNRLAQEIAILKSRLENAQSKTQHDCETKSLRD